MFLKDKGIWVASVDGERVCLPTKMANRHGLIAGATGTGKTITLKVMAESFADAGVPVILTDVKGDLSGMLKSGENTEDIKKRIEFFGLNEEGFELKKYPTAFWDVYGKYGIPLRTTISEMGPILLSKLLDLNDTQSDILTCLFKMADDENLLLTDIKDLKALLSYANDNSAEISREYGNMNKQSIAAIMRAIVALEASGGNDYFSEPAINIADFFKTDIDGRGIINIVDGRSLAIDPTLYSSFLLYLLSELFETLPEVGDLDRPRMVFFFDEAHLLFKDMSKALEKKIEQIVKLIRSKGVGLYFITQSPADIPAGVLGQLGNKVQHALHAYTPSEEKAIKVAADSFRTNPEFNTKEALQELGVGEALISFLEEDGVPMIVKRCKVLPPQSLMGTIEDDERIKSFTSNNLYLSYKDAKDVDSAYEYLERLKSQKDLAELEEKKAQEEQKALEKEQLAAKKAEEKEILAAQKAAEKEAIARQKQKEKEDAAKKKKINRMAGNVAKSAAGTVGREVGQTIGDSIGGKFGKKIGGNVASQLARSIMGTLFK